MARGMVKFFNPGKGFGFIAPEDGNADIFVHASAQERSGLRDLHEGGQVTFEVEKDRRSGRLAATDLQVTGYGSPSPSASRPDQRSHSNFCPHGGASRPAGGIHGSASR